MMVTGILGGIIGFFFGAAIMAVFSVSAYDKGYEDGRNYE